MSSRTPASEENSCSTFSILIEVTAAPCREDSSTRRSALPSVRPKPRSSGSATNVALRLGSPPALISRLLGYFNYCQFFMLTVMYFPWELGGGPVVVDHPAGRDKGTASLPATVMAGEERGGTTGE